MNAITIPHFTLNHRLDIPVIGFGVFQTPPTETTHAMKTAVPRLPDPRGMKSQSFATGENT